MFLSETPRAAPRRASFIPSSVAAVPAPAIDLSSRALLAVMKIERFFFGRERYVRELYCPNALRSKARVCECVKRMDIFTYYHANYKSILGDILSQLSFNSFIFGILCRTHINNKAANRDI